jgi:hypothetical protein
MGRTAIRIVVTLGAVAAIVFFLFPLMFAIRVDVPAKTQFASASSMMFQISNQNPTPVTGVTYNCEVARFTLANGTPVTDANVLNRGNMRRIGGRSAAAGRCQTGYLITAPLKTAEYKLTVTYTAYPWTRVRTRVWKISADFNAKSEVTGWKAE